MIDPLLDMARQGGLVLIGIVAASILAWTLLFWEWTRLYERTLGGWQEIERVIEGMQAGRPVKVAAVDDKGKNFVARLLRSEVIQRRCDRSSFEAQVMPLLNSETVMFQRTIRLVGVLAASMPLLGLLGTVLGMIQTFSALTDHGVAEADALAGGISQALITTQAGLVIAVPILLINNYLAARIRRYLDTASVMLKRIETAICWD